MTHHNILRRHISKLGLLLFLLLTIISIPVKAQYFGQNLVRYKNLKFKVNESKHFALYDYLKNDSITTRFLQESEIWYDLHQQVFRDTFSRRNPVILYANHPDFQSTTAISGGVGVGTGGVTEGLKNRVVMPLMPLNHQTRHVLGHELVHAFQYHSLIEGDSTNLENIGNLPLWMVEGMAEYLSIGKVDAFTAMWMRDAYLNRDIPTLRDLTTTNRYFPYRYGQAFWTYIGSTYGDTVIVPLFKATAKFGYEMAIRRTFGYDEKTLSSLWRTSIEATYKPLLKDTSQIPIGKNVLNSKNAGEMNVAPAISPDGKYIAYLSEKDLLSIDLFLADAQTGKTIRKLTSKATNSHIDEFSFIESAGAWSADSKRFAFSAFSSGRTKLFVIDVKNGKNLQVEGIEEVGEFSNVSFAPNGDEIAFTGLKDGYSDLFIYNLRSKKLTQLTNDKFSDYAPSFSPDGRSLVFTSDRTTLEASNTKGVDITHTMAVMDLETRRITNIPVFEGANNMNPQFSANSQQIYFLSNRDGFRNMYRYSLSTKKVEQLTDYFTGISGITEYSPALSLSLNDDVVYSYYRAQKYTIYNAKTTDFKAVEVSPTALNFEAATLPPTKSVGVDLINANLNNFERFETIAPESIATVPYRPQFKLDYIANNGVGASVGGRFGSGLSGGVQGIFSDILGRNQIFAAASVNGEIVDFGGQVAYVNQQSRIDIGASISHIPYLSGFVNYGEDQGYLVENQDILRTFADQLQVFASYPFSRIHRFEAGTGVSYYSYRLDRYSRYYDEFGLQGIEKKRITNEEAARDPYYSQFGMNFKAFTAFTLNSALVGDNSLMGITAPLDGFRYRIGIDKVMGDIDFSTLTVDLRKYHRIKPITLAIRAFDISRLGRDAERFYPQSLAYPYYIRGYEFNSFYKNGSQNSLDFNLNHLNGSSIAVMNFEVRLPFTGPKKLSAISSKFLFSDLNAFFDMGVAYDQGSRIVFTRTPTVLTRIETIKKPPLNGVPQPDEDIVVPYTDPKESIVAMSAGLSLRVNVFGYFIIEPYAAIPFQRKDIKGLVFGLTFAPGW
ncbi:MAG: PD40 domain-containing protein [Pyrinomonadaceae bacterium]|nr:PD40 domain-containing protein [Sphingobacteriaceae bacterium]